MNKDKRKNKMSNSKIGVAVVGTGSRAYYVVKNLLNDSDGNVEIRRVFDPDMAVAKESVAHWGGQQKFVKIIRVLLIQMILIG